MFININHKCFEIKSLSLDTTTKILHLELHHSSSNKISYEDKKYTHDYGLFIPYTETITKQDATLDISLEGSINFKEASPIIKTYTGEDHY